MTKEEIFELVKTEYEKLIDLPMGANKERRMAKIEGQVIGMLKAFRELGMITPEEATDMMEEII